MKIRIIPLTEAQINDLPFPDTARCIGGIAVLDEDELANHLNMEKFRQLWNEVIAQEQKFKTPVIRVKQPQFDPSKPCSWCNPCSASHCDCGECDNKECKVCHKLAEIEEKREKEKA